MLAVKAWPRPGWRRWARGQRRAPEIKQEPASRAAPRPAAQPELDASREFHLDEDVDRGSCGRQGEIADGFLEAPSARTSSKRRPLLAALKAGGEGRGGYGGFEEEGAPDARTWFPS
jgi:hypothetical protein